MSAPPWRVVLLLGTAMLALVVAFNGAPAVAELAASATARPQELDRAVSGDGAFRHMRELQEISGRHGRTRAAGTPGHKQSAAYIAQLMRVSGYEVTLQEFTFPYSEDRRNVLQVVSPTPRSLLVDTMEFSPATPAAGITAPVAVAPVDADPGCQPEDFAGDKFRNAVALIKRGTCPFAVKAANAAGAGALAALIYNNDPARPDAVVGGTLGDATAAKIPTGGMSLTQGAALATEAAAATVTVNVQLEELREQRRTHNVFAETKTGRADRVVMAGAHLDSVSAGPGINDNGSGSAALVEIAQKVAQFKPANKIRFAWWSAEELGLLGAAHYVKTLSAGQQQDIAMYLNFDMIASPNHFFGIYDGDNSDGVGAGPGPAGSAEIEKAFERAFNERKLPFEGTDFSGRSDYGPFIAAGIPSGGLFTGAEGIKTPTQAARYGGTAGQAYDPCYHQRCDTQNNLNRAALDVNTRVIAKVVSGYAFDPALARRQPVAPPPPAAAGARAKAPGQDGGRAADDTGVHGNHVHTVPA